MFSVLHANGDRDQQKQHTDFLAARGLRVHTAAGGVECVEKLRQLTPNFLILDHELPWGGGTGVLAIMREEPRLGRIPVVMTSAVSSVQTLNKLAVPPVVSTFAKPFRVTELLETIVSPRRSANGPSGNRHLIANLEREIQTRTGRRVQDLSVEYVDGGLLVVHGQVQSYHAKQLILVATMNYLAGRGIEACFDIEVCYALERTPE